MYKKVKVNPYLKYRLFCISVDICKKKEPVINGSFSDLTSTYPNKVNKIEIKEMFTKYKKPLDNVPETKFYSLRVYYGENGSILKKYRN